IVFSPPTATRSAPAVARTPATLRHETRPGPAPLKRRRGAEEDGEHHATGERIIRLILSGRIPRVGGRVERVSGRGRKVDVSRQWQWRRAPTTLVPYLPRPGGGGQHGPQGSR